MVHCNHPRKSHHNVLLDPQMKAKLHIWVSVYVVLTSTRGKEPSIAAPIRS